MSDIHTSCRLGDLWLLEASLAQDPSTLNELDPKQGWSPLYRCVICGHEQAAAFLLSQGADPNLQNKIGEGPLHQAAANGSLRLVKALLDSKANPNLQQNGDNYADGETPLHKACIRGDLGVARLLLDSGANPDVQNATFGWTPLHYCSHSGNSEMWELLVSRGASRSVLDWHGKRASQVAKKTSALWKSLPVCPPDPPNDHPTAPAKRCITSTEEMKEKRRIRKGSPPLVPRLKLQEKKNVHSSFDSALNKSTEATSGSTKSQELTFSFRDIYGKRSTLEKWLRRYNLEILTDVLIDSGYDDLDQFLAQAQRLPISTEQLQNIGVKRRGHALRLLAALELELKAPDRKSPKTARSESWECCNSPNSAAGISAFPSLQVWLRQLGLELFYQNFVVAGFEDLEPLLLVMKTSYAFTDSSLEHDFGIEKPGHRHRLLSKLKEDSLRFDPLSAEMSHTTRPGLRLERGDRSASCELCAVMCRLYMR